MAPPPLTDRGDPGPAPAAGGSVDVGLSVVKGQVVMLLNRTTNIVVFDPQNAFELGELMARTAHEARFPGERPPDRAYLAEQIRARVTDEIRQFLLGRATVMLNSQREKKTVPNAKLAEQLVDQLLSALT